MLKASKRFVRTIGFLSVLAAPVLTSSPAQALNCSLQEGQQQINLGLYSVAIDTFSCVMANNPQEVDAYRGRSEAKLMLDQYSDAYRDMYAYAIASIQPANIVALGDQIIASYDTRLASPSLCASPNSIPCVAARKGASLVRWAYFHYADALPILEQILQANPNSVYAKLFRGSNRMFDGGMLIEQGKADIDAAIAAAPYSAHVRYIAADAWTYYHLLPTSAELDRSYDEAYLAYSWGLDTPRVRAILAAGLNDVGDVAGAAAQLQVHLNQSTSQYVTTAALTTGSPINLDLVPWRTYQIPMQATAGVAIKVTTSSSDNNVWDTLLVVLNPAGVPVYGADDDNNYFADVDYVPPTSGTYTLRVTSFEAISTGGPLKVKRNQ